MATNLDRLIRLAGPTSLSRRLSVQSVLAATGDGVFATGSAVFFTQIVGLSAARVGLGLSISGAATFLLAVPLGKLGDRFGTRRVWALASLCEALAYLLWLTIGGFAAYAAMTIALGLIQTTSRAARNAYRLDVFPPEERVRIQAYFRAALNIGFTLGALLAGVALATDSDTVVRGVPVMTAVLLLVNAALVSRLPTAAGVLAARADATVEPQVGVGVGLDVGDGTGAGAPDGVAAAVPAVGTSTATRRLGDVESEPGLVVPAAAASEPATASATASAAEPAVGAGTEPSPEPSTEPSTSDEPSAEVPLTQALEGALHGDPRTSALRNRGFVAMSILDGVLATHQVLLNVVIPLWLVEDTDAPRVLLAWLFGTNTVLTVLLQVAAARGVNTVKESLRAERRGAGLLVLSCAITLVTHDTVGWLTIALVWLGHVTVTGSELLQSAGEWGLQAELSDGRRRGEYQGVSQLGYTLGTVWAPAAYTYLALTLGTVGWIAIAAIVLLALAALHPATRAAQRHFDRIGATT